MIFFFSFFFLNKDLNECYDDHVKYLDSRSYFATPGVSFYHLIRKLVENVKITAPQFSKISNIIG